MNPYIYSTYQFVLVFKCKWSGLKEDEILTVEFLICTLKFHGNDGVCMCVCRQTSSIWTPGIYFAYVFCFIAFERVNTSEDQLRAAMLVQHHNRSYRANLPLTLKHIQPCHLIAPHRRLSRSAPIAFFCLSALSLGGPPHLKTHCEQMWDDRVFFWYGNLPKRRGKLEKLYKVLCFHFLR